MFGFVWVENVDLMSTFERAKNKEESKAGLKNGFKAVDTLQDCRDGGCQEECFPLRKKSV